MLTLQTASPARHANASVCAPFDARVCGRRSPCAASVLSVRRGAVLGLVVIKKTKAKRDMPSVVIASPIAIQSSIIADSGGGGGGGGGGMRTGVEMERKEDGPTYTHPIPTAQNAVQSEIVSDAAAAETVQGVSDASQHAYV
eukprot:1175352-Prymnesium_polylepis.2